MTSLNTWHNSFHLQKNDCFLKFIALIVRTRWLLGPLLEDQTSYIVWLPGFIGGTTGTFCTWTDILGGPNM